MKNKAKTTLIVSIIFIFMASGLMASPKITADSFILLEMANLEVLLEGNGFAKRPPASTTKILTGLLALKLADLDEIVEITLKAASVGDASIHLRKGEMFFLQDLIKGALIKSGNDAAYAIAEQIAGDEKLFLDLMNRKARVLGAVNTQFINPHGLPDESHYSSAYDLALITSYALRNPTFAEIVSSKYERISSLNTNRIIDLSNTNKLLWKSPEFKGVKTGTTIKAGNCLVSAMEKDGRKLIAVVLKSSNRFGDSERLLTWGLKEFSLFEIKKKERLEVLEIPRGYPSLVTVTPLFTLPISIPHQNTLETEINWFTPLSPPIKKGDVLGELICYQKDQVIKKIPMVAGENVILAIKQIPLLKELPQLFKKDF